MAFGQLVIGPPGSGKSTYCAGLAHYYALAGRRAAVVNLDPASDAPPYEAAFSVQELVTADAVQRERGLGPNGAMLHCMERLEANLAWFRGKLQPLLVRRRCRRRQHGTPAPSLFRTKNFTCALLRLAGCWHIPPVRLPRPVGAFHTAAQPAGGAGVVNKCAARRRRPEAVRGAARGRAPLRRRVQVPVRTAVRCSISPSARD